MQDKNLTSDPPGCQTEPSASAGASTRHPTHHSGNPECGLRELKRLKTHRDITDAATSLVLQAGYDAVNIEDICAQAGISRRTFFNYFDSKDQSIFGDGLIKYTDEDEKRFLVESYDDPLMAMLDQIERSNRAKLQHQTVLPNSEEFHRELRDRIQQILRNEPKLSAVVISNFAEAIRRIRRTFEQYFDRYPDARRCDSLPIEHEITLSVGFIRECVFYSSLHLDIFETETPLHDAAAAVATFMRRMA